MKAWRFYSPGDMRLDDLPQPKAKPGWVVVRVRVVQLSVTEVIWFTGGATRGSEAFTKELQRRAPVQLLGHEYSGEVVEVGEGVTSLKTGDRVAAGGAVISCGECPPCRSGLRSQCRSLLLVGRDFPGCLAEYAALPTEILVKIPQTVSYNEGACIQPLTSCLTAVYAARVELGDSVVVLGQGAMGLGVMQIARVSGAGRIITTDRRDLNLKLSRELGADEAIDVTGTDPVEAVRELTRGLGADIAFEAAGGSPQEGLSGTTTFYQALQMVRTGGKVVQVANLGPKLEVNPHSLAERAVKYLFPDPGAVTTRNREHLVHLLATKRVRVEPTITHILQGLDEMPQAFEITGNKARHNAVNPAQVVVA